MKNYKPVIGSLPLHFSDTPIEGSIVDCDGEQMYRIRNFDRMHPFLMSIVSSGDLWLYLSSKGGLTAGRQNYNNALFPYETDDKLHQAANITGPITIVRLLAKQNAILWEPFSDKYPGLYATDRNIYKNITGDKVILEEINFDLKLTFRYSWMNSDTLGWVRHSEISNNSDKTHTVELLDGLLNLQPWGVSRELQSMMSTLMDAYKVAEFLQSHNMALYYLSSIPVDRAEPSEALRTNLVWTAGLPVENMLLSPIQINEFRNGADLSTEHIVYGQKNAFIVKSTFELPEYGRKTWYIVSDVAKDHPGVAEVQRSIEKQICISEFIEKSVKQSNQRLRELVTLSDGVQNTGDALNDRRHFANVMFNIMRGGIFEQEYNITKADFIKHLIESNPFVYAKHTQMLSLMKEMISLQELIQVCSFDDDLARLALEYLPLSFSRRHGDPSRPWNFFDIRVKKEDGTPYLNYQGNWRDIFQNWEALANSFPAYLPGMIARFLNASTADGYNPYRITRNGFEWEVPEPDNPWAYIGYWGDHQIIYMLRLMELQEKFFPGARLQNANRKLFVYARSPYRIKTYSEIIKNPQDTIVFNRNLHDSQEANLKSHGSDARLMHYASGSLCRAGFMEKILVTLLTKLSNFVPDAGIWLNTQRPEWNDANNALVGNGASVVTLCHARRFLGFIIRMMENSEEKSFNISTEVSDFYKKIFQIFKDFNVPSKEEVSPAARKTITDALGIAGEHYRESVYAGFSGSFRTIAKEELLNFCNTAIHHLDRSIFTNRRTDGLYHSYNLIGFNNRGVEVTHLHLMLEGQVAILNSGLLTEFQTIELLEALFSSNLWRPDQKSFMLYPWKQLPDFMQKNNITPELAKQSNWLLRQIKENQTDIVKQDEAGALYFNPDLRNGRILHEQLLKHTENADNNLTQQEREIIEDIYENVFRHRYFTGRSGSFYKYEGIGSIYWHMVSKLLLAVGESISTFEKQNQNGEHLQDLFRFYYLIREGIGVHKSPGEYGAFPTDPYSHTPSMSGVQQPGLTGQVKEDILSRFMELGISIEKGQVHLQKQWFTKDLFDTNGKFVFSLFNTEFVVENHNPINTKVEFNNPGQADLVFQSLNLPVEVSNELFLRKRTIRRVVFS